MAHCRSRPRDSPLLDIEDRWVWSEAHHEQGKSASVNVLCKDGRVSLAAGVV